MRKEQRASSWKDLKPSCILLARAFGTLRDHGAFPGFVPGGDGLVEGEFMRFEDVGAALARFDRIEGFAGFGSARNLFRRTLVEVDAGGGRIRTAWTYATCTDGAPLIAGGDWRRAKGRQRPAMSAILSAHASTAPDFFAKLACVLDGPFGTVCEIDAGHDEILMRLVTGGFDERGLCRASGLWNAGA